MFEQLTEKLDSAFRRLRGSGSLTQENMREGLREVRRALLEADVNVGVAKSFIQTVEERAIGRDVLKGLSPGQQIVQIVYEELVALLGGESRSLRKAPALPSILMMVGLQGSGKTSFCGKLAVHLRKRQQRVLLAACDVVRPAAIDQLEMVAKGIDVPVYARRDTADVVAIARGAVSQAKLSGADYLILDTAGRLHIDEMRMDELTRLRDDLRPAETLLVVDGMTGQDAVRIGETFNARLGVDGVILTKMDGDARGGAALSVRAVTGRPILFLGSGEKPSDIMEFHPDRIASRILGMGDVLTLVERAQEELDVAEARKLEEKFRKSTFTLDDFLKQLRQVQKMGPIEDLLKMLPGVGAKIKDLEFDPKAMKRIEAIICSMTREERRNPKVVDGSRRKRISRGSGTSVQEVNQLLRRFAEMSSLMKKLSKSKGGRPRLPFPV